MKKLFLLFLFFFGVPPLWAADKYTFRQRFGYGYSSSEPLANFAYQDLEGGWFFNWNQTLPQEDRLPMGMEYFGLVGGYSKGNFPATLTDSRCLALRDKIRAKPALYPDGMSWFVGNEIGWDDQRTADEYATAFIGWYACLKSLNPTFRVGTGALMSPRRYLPYTGGQAPNWCEFQPGSRSACWCIHPGSEDTDPNGSLAYFRRYLARIKYLAPDKMPDFINQHLYPLIDCYEDPLQVEALKASLYHYRQVMREQGLQHLDLILSEWGPLDRRLSSAAQIGDFMEVLTTFFLTAKDPSLGQPEDDYRLVQRFAWFVFTFSGSVSDNNNYPNLHLFDPVSHQITTLGQRYQQLARRYVSNFICSVCPAPAVKTQGDANCDGKINGLDFVLWAQSDSAADFTCRPDQTAPEIDLADFLLWLTNYNHTF